MRHHEICNWTQQEEIRASAHLNLSWGTYSSNTTQKVGSVFYCRKKTGYLGFQSFKKKAINMHVQTAPFSLPIHAQCRVYKGV